MGDFFIGEIRAFSFAFAPNGWALANGAVLQTNQNQALYSLLQNNYGGQYPTTFALPNLCGVTPIGYGAPPNQNAIPLASKGGTETVALAPENLPSHNHSISAQQALGNATVPANDVFAEVRPDSANNAVDWYVSGASSTVTLAPQTITTVPSAAAAGHPNMQPFAVVNYCIALQGVYPSRN